MTKEEYLAFLDLETKYEAEKARLEEFAIGSFKKLHFIARKNNLEGRHHGVLSDSVEFGLTHLGCYADCCGDPTAKFYSISLKDLLDEAWQKDLDDQVKEVQGLINDYQAQQKAKEVESLQKRLKELNG